MSTTSVQDSDSNIEREPRARPQPIPLTKRERGVEPGEVVVVHRLLPGDVARAGLVLIALGLGAYLIWRVQEVILLLFLAIMLATAIEPIVNRLRHGPFSQGSGVLLVYTAIVLAIATPTFLLAPSLIEQSTAFTEGLPDRIEGLRPYVEQLRPQPVQQIGLNAINRLASLFRYPEPPPEEELVEAGAIAMHTIVGFVMVFVIAYYWLMERLTLKRALLRVVGPRRARKTNLIWTELEDRIGGWVRGQLTLMLLMMLMAGIGYLLIGLPSPILLAVIAGLGEMIPIVGPFIAFAPAVLVALLIDPSKALMVVVYAIVIHLIEANILVPRIMSRSVGISPLTVVLGIHVGIVLYGLPGALLAVPVAGVIQVVLAHALSSEEPEIPAPPATATPETSPPPVEPRQASARE